MDYKDTLFLPTTDFAMRGALPQNEPARFRAWYDERKIYEKMKAKRKGASVSFNIHDGPPYANETTSTTADTFKNGNHICHFFFF